MIENKQIVGLPEELRAQFAGLERRLWKAETLATLSLIVGSLLVSCLTLFISDRFWDTPVWLRVALAALGFSGLAWFGLRWLRLWVFRRRDQRALAILVQSKYRRLGDRLLGIVELADETQRPAYFSPALYRAAIEQVAAEARPFDFAAAVDGRPARLATMALGTILAIAALPVLLSPPASLNALERWMMPTARVDRFSLVSLEGLPRELIVPHGESFEVSCSVQYRSLWKPARAVAQVERQPKVVVPVGRQHVTLRLPGQVQRGVLKVRIGDARSEVALAPTYRPSLKELSALVQLPSYLKYPASTQTVEGAALDVLAGSRVGFKGRVTRSLSAAQMQAGGEEFQALPVQTDAFSSDPMDLEGISEVSFTWRDQFGLTNGAPWRLQVRPQQDVPPSPELTDLQKDTAILESEVLDLKMLARDDFGVRDLGVDWQLLSDLSGTNPPPRPFNFEARTAQEKKLEETFHFSPGLLLIPPDSIVEVRGFATDYFPDRQASQTPVYRVHVLGNERHAELVRQNLESLLTRLEEVTRLEEKVSASTKELQDMSKEKLQTDETGDRIASAKDDQNQNAANLEQLAKEGKKTLREAFRNPTFSEETLKDWAKNLQDMQQLSEEKMQQASQALKSAQQNAEARPEKLAQAAQKEQEILDALEQMQRKVNKGLDQLQALTLAQRLRKIGADEKEIAERLHKIVPEIIGMFPKELPDRFRTTESSLASDQDAAQKETQVLQGEIGRFFERTQKDTYGQVTKEMTEAHTTDELDRLRGLIEENIAMDAAQNLGDWSDRLKAWADLLEPKSENSGGEGAGGEGGGSDEAMLKELLGLLRARDREVNLRQRTALLEKRKPDPEQYRQSARSLAGSQGQVRDDVGKIQGENPMPALEFPLQEIIDSMKGVETLLNKPQTDRETDLAQTKSVELLSDVINLINEQQQRKNNSSPSQTSSAEEMAFLMQMMALQNNPSQGMSVNPKGGGSMAGGTTDRASVPALGDPNARLGDSRTVNRASGSTANLPTEFREALENYFQGLEKLESKR